VAGNGAIANDHILAPAISGNGRVVTYTSPASNLVPGDTNGLPDIFLRERGQLTGPEAPGR
jgi:hypothetical protein